MVPREPPDLLPWICSSHFLSVDLPFFVHCATWVGLIWVSCIDLVCPVYFVLIWVSSCFHFCLSSLLQLRWFFVVAALWVDLPWNHLADVSPSPLFAMFWIYPLPDCCILPPVGLCFSRRRLSVQAAVVRSVAFQLLLERAADSLCLPPM